MRLLLSWLRDFVDVEASADAVAEMLGVRGFEVAGVEPLPRDDAVIDFEVTANRPDCLSVVGLAREVSTAYDLPMRLPSRDPDAPVPLAPTPIGEADGLRVVIDDPELCPRYAAAVADVTHVPTPAWMAYRLKAAGVRPIGVVVDITNYVLLEIGHPMHAFDLDRLGGGELRIRRARPGETITTLDGAARTLDGQMLVITDDSRPQAVAGVMGGAHAEVSPSTTRVALESAYFKPASVRQTSKRLGLKTEASFRFERGADINAPVAALERAIALLDRLGAGRIRGAAIDRYPVAREPVCVHLRRARVSRLLGVDVPDGEVERILRRLGFWPAAAGEGWDVLVPTFRVDIGREVDLIEEVGRHFGFDKLPATFPPMQAPAAPSDPRIARDRLVRRVMTAAGLSEAVTFGFIEAKAAEPFASGSLIPVKNPLSAKFDTLRPSLLPGLIDAVIHNRRHGRDDVALFEIGTRFSTAGETRGVGVAWQGSASPPHWSTAAREVDFFDVKGLAEQVCRVLDIDPQFEPIEAPFLVAGQAAAIVTGSVRLGSVGHLEPSIAESRGAPRADTIFALELDLDAIAAARRTRVDAVGPLPRYPFVVRDLSIVVDDALPAAIIRGTIQAASAGAPAPLVEIGIFDRYRGTGVPEGSISLSLRLTFQAADRTLTDAEVQQSFDTILGALVHTHGAVQR
jgi:phenylalanyl-tRNA synthetase beta chain